MSDRLSPPIDKPAERVSIPSSAWIKWQRSSSADPPQIYSALAGNSIYPPAPPVEPKQTPTFVDVQYRSPQASEPAEWRTALAWGWRIAGGALCSPRLSSAL